MKKHPFLLFEILIALLLVILCAVPLVHEPLKFYQAEMKGLLEIEKERLADWTFTEVKEILLRNEIPWEKIPSKHSSSGLFPLPAAAIELPGYQPKLIERRFFLKCEGELTGKQNEEYRQIYVIICLDRDEYEFRLPIQKINIE